MPVDVRGFNLTPQLGSVQQGLQTAGAFQQLGQQNIQRSRGEQIKQLLGQIGQEQPQTEQQQMLAAQTAELGGAVQPQAIPQEQLIAQARRIDPAIADKQLKQLGLDDPTKRAEASRFASELQSTPFKARAEKITARAQSLQAQGRDPKDTLQLLDMNPAQQEQALTGVQLLDLSTKERFAAKAAGAKANIANLKKELAGTKETFDRASKLRGEIAKASTDFNKQEGAWTRVKASAENPTPAGDLALIFNFMKVLDPGSTVREGEFAQVGAAGNLPTQVQRMYQSWATGQKLTDEQRGDVVDRAKKLFTAAEKSNKKDIAKFVSVGKQFGVSKENLLGAGTPPPPPGFVIQGQ